MSWYLTKNVYRIICGQGNHTAQFDEQLRLIEADSSQEAFEKATELDRNNVGAFLLLANVQVSLGLTDQAVADYERALQNNPRDVRIYFFLSTLLESRGEWQRAEELCRRALQIERQ